MNIKIQGGGGGKYANTGSSSGIVAYLLHEDAERAAQGQPIEPFFDQSGTVGVADISAKIDGNIAKLCRDDAKFFCFTVSPSKKEIEAMGATEQERTEALKKYVREDIMRLYASGFGKGLTKDDVLYFAKIHHSRNDDNDGQMHAHIIVSRKDKSNRIKLSPNTNHRGNKPTGTVKGGFDRSFFFLQGERAFDAQFAHLREVKNSFEYCNAMKNGSVEERQEAIEKSVRQECHHQRPQETPGESNSLSVLVDIGTAIGGLLDVMLPPPTAPTPAVPATSAEKKKKKKRKRGQGKRILIY
jgi:hypothetical protein